MIRVLAVSALALGFAGTALADRGHDHDRGRWERYERHNERHDDRRYERPRYYRAAPPPRYEQRWRAPRPHGWHPGWREPYRGGYRYWNNDYYYVVPGPPSLGLSLTIPLR